MQVKVEKPTVLPLFKTSRVAAYARVSVDTEMSEHSLENQVNYYSSFIKHNPAWSFVGVYADEGFTGTKAKRPGFQNLLNDCEAGKIDIVLVKSISRFARNTVDLLNVTRHLKEIGVNIWFEKENIYSISYEGELLITLLASFAQEESRSVSENCKWAIRKRFEQGIGNWYHMYGYKYENDEFVVVPEEAETVKLVFSLYLDGKTPHQIVNILDEKGLRTRTGEKFIYTRICKMLRQEKYTGNSLLQKTYRENHLSKRKMNNHGELQMYYVTDTNPAIINQETFDAVQTEIAERASLSYLANQKTNFSCLTGKIVCGNCGHTYRRHQRSKQGGRWKTYQWRCGTKISKGTSACPAQNISEKLIFSLLRSILDTEEITPELINNEVRRITVFSPLTVVFELSDGRTVTKRWEYDEKTKIHKEIG